MLCPLHRPLPTTWPTDVTTMSILKQLATEQINFNMNGYGVEQDVIEVSEEEFHGEGTRGRSYTADTATALSRRQVTCPAVAPQPGRSNNRNHLFDCAGQGCGAYLPIQVQTLGAHELCMDIIATCL